MNSVFACKNIIQKTDVAICVFAHYRISKRGTGGIARLPDRSVVGSLDRTIYNTRRISIVFQFGSPEFKAICSVASRCGFSNELILAASRCNCQT